MLRILLSFMKIAVLSFGGGYASVPLVEKEIVEIQGWMTYQEFSDLMALDELTPGPILLNSATFVGMKVAGIPGAVMATLGCMIPPCVISFLLIFIYSRYRKMTFIDSALQALKCMAVALILTTFLKIFLNGIMPAGIAFANIELKGVILMVASFILINRLKVQPIYVMLGCGLINLILGAALGV